MYYSKRIGILSLALMFFVSLFVFSSETQAQVRVRAGSRGGTRAVPQRSIIIRRNPYYYNGYYRRGFYDRGFWGDPFWNDPYYTNPRLRALADRVYYEDRVRSQKKDIRKYTEKINKDGYVTDKEREKLAKKYREYNKRLQKVRDADY